MITCYSIKQRDGNWHCKTCIVSIINAQDDQSIVDNNVNLNVVDNMSPKSKKKCKCGKCQKNMSVNLQVINCDTCKKYFHVKCSGTSKQSFLKLKNKNKTWTCYNCVSKLLPFSGIDNNELFLELQNKPNLINATPSFTIQFLLDQMPGQNFETGQFMSEGISSKYFTPSKFIESKLSPNKFSMVHINIASLNKHIDELGNLIYNLEHPFDIIGITETRLYDNVPLTNIEIDGYEFRHTPTITQYGGAGIYVKSCYGFDVRNELSESIPNVSESLFIELYRIDQKNYYYFTLFIVGFT